MPDIEFPTDFPAYTPPLTGTRQVMLDGQESATVDDIAYYAAGRTGGTLIWRPVVGPPPAPTGVIYANIVTLLAAVANTTGVVRIFLDSTGGGAFEIPAGAYPFLCYEIAFTGTGPETLIFQDGVTFTGVSRFRYGTCQVSWQGATAPLCSTTSGIVFDGPVSMFTDGSTVPMFYLPGNGGLVFNGPFNAMSGFGDYELIETAGSLYTFPGFYGSIAAETIRGAGGVAVIYDSTGGSQVNVSQPNLAGGVVYSDTGDGLVTRGRKLPLLTGSAGSLYYGDLFPFDETGLRNLTVVAEQYGSDRTKAAQFAFTGTQGYSSTDAFFSLFGNMTVEAIITGINVTLTDVILLTQGGSAGTFDRRFFIRFNGRQLYWGYDDNVASSENVVISRQIHPFERFIVHCVRTVVAGDTTLDIWINGRQIGSAFFPVSIPDNSGPNALFFGQSATASNRLGTGTNPSFVSQLYVDDTAWTFNTITARAKAAGLMVA